MGAAFPGQFPNPLNWVEIWVIYKEARNLGKNDQHNFRGIFCVIWHDGSERYRKSHKPFYQSENWLFSTV